MSPAAKRSRAAPKSASARGGSTGRNAPSGRGAAPTRGTGGTAAEKAAAGKLDRQRQRSDAGRRKSAATAAARRGAADRETRAPRDPRAGDPVDKRRPPPKSRGLGGEQVEGRQAVRELLLAGRRRVKEVWVATREADDPRFDEHVDDLAELAESVRVPVREVARKRLLSEARTESPQGVLAFAAPLPEFAFDDLLSRRDPQGRPPFLVAVDGVTDPGNLGALLRSAECAGATGVVLPRHRAVHVTPTVTKTAAGAVEHLPMAIVGGLPTAVLEMQKAGIWVVGLDMDGTPIHEADLPADAGVCLVLGAEGQGLSRLVRQRCDVIVSLPLRGALGSLNVAAAAAVACYEVAGRRP